MRRISQGNAPWSIGACAAVLLLSCALVAPAVDHAVLRVRVAISDGHGKPYALPSEGELRVGTNEWKTVALPYIETVHDLTPGEVELRINGYDAAPPKYFVPSAGGEAEFVFELVPHNAEIAIECDTPGARIYLKEEEIGTPGTPLIVAPFQTYSLTIRAPGHRDAQIVLDHPEPGCSPCVYHVNLERIPATLRIHAENPNRFRRLPKAEILIDGSPAAVAFLPHVLGDVTQAQAMVSIRVPGFRDPSPQLVHLRPGEETEAVFPLEYPDAFFEFRVVPSNALIRIGEDIVATNPCPVIPNRMYAIRVDAPMHRGVSLTDAAPPGATQVVSVTLVPRTYIEFVLSPSNAVVFMAGRRITDRIVEVEPNQAYDIDIRAPQHDPYRTTVRVAPGETQQVEAALRKKLLPF